DNRVSAVLAGLIIPQVFAFFFLLGRVTTRIFVVKIWTWDDTLIVSAWVCTLSLSVLFGIGTAYGTGHHIKDVPLDLIQASFTISYGGILAYQVALCLTKLSILVFYLRAFPAKREQWMTVGTIIFVTSFSIPLIIGDALQCNPITGQSFVMPGIFCFTPEPFLKASAALHTITDAWMILMVIPVVLTLNIPKSQIYTLLGIISLGGFVIVASIARITTILNSAGTTDFTLIIADFDIWSVLESCTGLICACAPTVRPL
ncbi:hypothetical protein BGZ60DRAFT_351088, partial [Tricladium varicosporioides]